MFFAKSAPDLQVMLNKLADWCTRWGLIVNCEKTKIVHFRQKSKCKTRYPFKCGEQHIMVCDRYRYLGLWFTEFIDFSFMAKQVAMAG